MRRTRKLRLRLVLAGTAGLAVVAFVAATSASPPHEPDLTSVASANTRSARLRTVVEVLGRTSRFAG
jgi:hypothetical protein